MNLRMVAGTLAVSLSLLGTPGLHAAAVSGIHLPMNARFGKAKMISLKVQNASQTPVTVKAGDQQITVQPGMTGSLKVMEGTLITNVDATPTMTAGLVIATATSNLNDSTLTIR